MFVVVVVFFLKKKFKIIVNVNTLNLFSQRNVWRFVIIVCKIKLDAWHKRTKYFRRSFFRDIILKVYLLDFLSLNCYYYFLNFMFEEIIE